MNQFMLGKKAGMTQIFDESTAVPVTVIECGPITVIRNITPDNEGYKAVQVGFESYKKGNKPEKGQFKKAGVEEMRTLREFRVDESASFEVGQVLTVADMFEKGAYVDIVGTSKGKGTQGAIRRWGAHRGPTTHGSKYHRAAGSNGPSATPSRVRKGKHMAGHLGNERVTVQNLQVVLVDAERNLLVVKGAVPGAKGSLLEIKKSVKSHEGGRK